MKELELMENVQLREQMINKVEVLDKVKSLLLIPQTELATVEQVADYYGVDIETIRKIAIRNKDELLIDGFGNFNKEKVLNFLKGQDVLLENFVGKSVVTLKTGEKVDIPNRGLRLFTKRSILRVGMLLRDSEVAKEIRTKLLDIAQDTEDKAPEIIQQVVAEITIEQQLKIGIADALLSGVREDIGVAYAKYIQYEKGMHDKRVSQLENDNKALANGILEWEDRSKLNKGIRVLAGKVGIRIGDLWLELYNQLLYKYHINLKARNNGKKPYINNIKENEWESVIKCFSALCKYYGYSPTELINQLEVE